jgi:hypothetical protein
MMLIQWPTDFLRVPPCKPVRRAAGDSPAVLGLQPSIAGETGAGRSAATALASRFPKEISR